MKNFNIHILNPEEKEIGKKPLTTEKCYNFIPQKGPNSLLSGKEVSEWVVDYLN